MGACVLFINAVLDNGRAARCYRRRIHKSGLSSNKSGNEYAVFHCKIRGLGIKLGFRQCPEIRDNGSSSSSVVQPCDIAGTGDRAGRSVYNPCKGGWKLMAAPTVIKWSDAGAPALTNAAGSLINVLAGVIAVTTKS